MSTSTSTSTPLTTGSSFRQRLRKLETQHLPPPPWPGGGSASAVSPQHPRSAISVEPRSAVSHHEPRSATRPPLSPRRLSAAAVTGQSRFVEGSMNDRVSAAPPPGFLGLENDDEDGDDVGTAFGWDGHHAAARRARAGSHTVGGKGERQHLRRPRSTAVTMQEQQQHQQRSGSNEGAGVAKRSSFLAPLWDGVREKLNLTRSKSSGSIGSIGKVVSSVVGSGGKLLGEKEREEHKVAASPAVGAGYPSREEVLESYKNLMASGFFEAHAIRGGRHPGPPRTGGQEAPEHGPVVVLPSPTGKSFADHMAAAQQQQQQQQQKQQHQQRQVQPACALSSPIRSNMGPPILPPRGSSQRKLDTDKYESSPGRGTKRGASIDVTGDADFSPRKLVKKLRHSASRISMELTGMMDNHLYHGHAMAKSRPSTSSHRSGPLSPTSSIFSIISSPPPARFSFSDETRASSRHGKLTKAKDGRRRRILGLTRRHRSPSPAAAAAGAFAEADPDAMAIDEPEPQPQAQSQIQQPGSRRSSTERTRKVPRILTPPPAAFRSHPPPPRLRTSSTSSSVASVQHVEEHEPLSIVPDPNQGIPFVPRIPREFCDAMSAMAPPATGAMMMGSGGGSGGDADPPKTEKGNRDSGLGEDVENIAVWG